MTINWQFMLFVGDFGSISEQPLCYKAFCGKMRLFVGTERMIVLLAPSTTHIQPHSILFEATNTILNHYHEPDLDLTAVAAIVRISPWYLSHLFKRYLGIGFRDYVNRVRLDHALTLLSSSQLALKEIAAKVGYKRVSDFHRHVRRYCFETPARMRRTRGAAQTG